MKNQKFKALVVGQKKDKILIQKIENHLKKVGGVGYVLLQRLPKNAGLIEWFRSGLSKCNRKSYKKVIK